MDSYCLSGVVYSDCGYIKPYILNKAMVVTFEKFCHGSFYIRPEYKKHRYTAE